jgi:Flp pilus assembly protein TadG
MTSKIPVGPRRRRSGNAALEAALVFMPLFALLLGIADFSFSMFLMGLFESASRDAARYATTFNLAYNGNTYTSMTKVAQQIVINETLGFISSSNVNTYVQVNYYFPDQLSSPATSAELPHTWTDSNTPPDTYTINYVNAPGNVVEVRVVGYPWNWMVPIHNFMPGSGMTIGSESVDVLQQLPVGVTTPPAY